MGKQGKQCQTLFWGSPKSLQLVPAAMKLKDAYSLEGKLYTRRADARGHQAGPGQGFPGASVVKSPPTNAGDVGSGPP